MKEIENLLQKSDKYLHSAEVLIKAKDYDSSVSRSYYAMFYAAEAVLLTKELSFSSHKSVIAGFGKHFIKEDIFEPELGRMLRKAFEKRQLGDYEFELVIDKEEAEKQLEEARIFVNKIKDYPEDSGYLNDNSDQDS